MYNTTICSDYKYNRNGLQPRIKILNSNCVPVQAHDGEWYDVKAAKDIYLNQYETVTIPLGFCLELPDGYEAHLLPRSSTFEKYGLLLTNGMGIIDNLYCGDNDEWKMKFFCIDTPRNNFIEEGTRIGQFRIFTQQPPMDFILVDKLNNEDRGGYGSSGEK